MILRSKNRKAEPMQVTSTRVRVIGGDGELTINDIKVERILSVIKESAND